MVFGEDSITSTPENGHALCAAGSLKVLIHNLPHEFNILGDLDLDGDFSALSRRVERFWWYSMLLRELSLISDRTTGLLLNSHILT